MTKLLSVIVPMYNSAKWLSKCIDSILNQDVPLEQMEIICVNDGSPDDSADIVRRYQIKYPNTIVLLEQDNQGPSGARNNGIRYANGKYLCFVDPDDYVEPYQYGALLQQMEREQLDAIRFDYYTENENYESVVEVKHPIKVDLDPQLMTGADFLGTRLNVQCYIWLYIFRRRVIVDNEIWCYVGDYYDDVPWLPRVLLKVRRMNVSKRKVQHYILRFNSLVRSYSPESVQRKIDGAKFVQKTLRQQMNDVTDKRVKRWYQMMLAHSSLGLLSHAASATHIMRNEIIDFLYDIGAFPLCTYKAPINVRIKIMIVNISPMLYCVLKKMIH